MEIDPLNKRIITLMVQSGHSKSSFAKELGASLPLITHITSGRNKPGIELIQKVLTAFPDVSPDWLINDSGSMYREKPKVADLSGAQARLTQLKSLIEKPKEAFETMQSFHKILMDEILHLQEMSIIIEDASSVLSRMVTQIDQVKQEIESEVNG